MNFTFRALRYLVVGIKPAGGHRLGAWFENYLLLGAQFMGESRQTGQIFNAKEMPIPADIAV